MSDLVVTTDATTMITRTESIAETATGTDQSLGIDIEISEIGIEKLVDAKGIHREVAEEIRSDRESRPMKTLPDPESEIKTCREPETSRTECAMQTKEGIRIKGNEGKLCVVGV